MSVYLPIYLAIDLIIISRMRFTSDGELRSHLQRRKCCKKTKKNHAHPRVSFEQPDLKTMAPDRINERRQMLIISLRLIYIT